MVVVVVVIHCLLTRAASGEVERLKALLAQKDEIIVSMRAEIDGLRLALEVEVTAIVMVIVVVVVVVVVIVVVLVSSTAMTRCRSRRPLWSKTPLSSPANARLHLPSRRNSTQCSLSHFVHYCYVLLLYSCLLLLLLLPPSRACIRAIQNFLVRITFIIAGVTVRSSSIIIIIIIIIAITTITTAAS